MNLLDGRISLADGIEEVRIILYPLDPLQTSIESTQTNLLEDEEFGTLSPEPSFDILSDLLTGKTLEILTMTLSL